MDYDETKKMVVDILKTDDGKKAIQEILNDDKMNETLVMDEKTVKETVEKTLTSKKGTEFWKKVFDDSKFAEGFAKTLQNEHETVLKKLMKDPDYQKMLMGVLQDPEMAKRYGDLVKTREFRTQLQQVITETLASPLYKKQFEEELKKAVEESVKDEMKGGGDKQS
ncbi:Spore germination protein GerD [Bacillus paralicheniformis]|uniref:Spore germination protein GerD n=2 Tax=Bacillus sonorensis TaxID=119858 RepID=M5NZ94_9BACI|nr:spore germination protein GerD [Bacillus sonorensis L12]TWK77333.1 Spore germination protein GerD [Bacillus paralicheniformis]